MKKWREENKEHITKYLEDPNLKTYRRAYQKEWIKRNVKHVTEYNKNMKLIRNNAPGNHTQEEWDNLKKDFDNKCACCRADKKLFKDHIVSILIGGTNNIDNIQPLCTSCNSRKRQKVIRYKARETLTAADLVGKETNG